MSVFGNTPDSPIEMAHSYFDGGCMDGDLAYIESLYSVPAFFHLTEIGVGFPKNEYGAYVGYKTDHDPRQRATSAGPETSKFMFECLYKEIIKREIPIYDNHTAVKIVSDNKRVCGLVAINREKSSDESLGITSFSCANIVLAGGGPGEMYAQSVLPPGQVSLHGIAFEAGAGGVNLGECQFGTASVKFRWNLSGSYQQVIPSYFSLDSDGKRYDFLSDYFNGLAEECSMIFLKGYQWPFNAQKFLDNGSSRVDIAVENEIRKGRKVFMDFMNNPGFTKALDFSILSDEARDYLNKCGCVHNTPYERLAHMNPASIEIYTRHNIDLKEPLEIAVSFQHNNGGIKIDDHYQTDVKGLFAIGECAGSHGVNRPGGSALNAGQVGGIRAAEFIAEQNTSINTDEDLLAEAVQDVYVVSKSMLNAKDNQKVIRKKIQQRMTKSAAFLRPKESVSAAIADAQSEIGDFPGAKNAEELSEAWETRSLQISHVAYLKSIEYYISNGGGSRGSYLILENDKPRIENEKDRKRQVVIDSKMNVYSKEVKPLPIDESWFETVWAQTRKFNHENPK